MALRLSTGMRNKLLEGTQGFKQLFDDGVMDIYSGTIPSTPDAPETGTLLVRITVGSATCGADGTGIGPAGENGLNFGTASNGSITKSAETWSGVGTASGEAGYFRFYDTNIEQGTSGTYATTSVRMDGVCAVSGGDLNMADLTITAGLTTTIDSFSITLPTY